jgi:hypothetical protein
VLGVVGELLVVEKQLFAGRKDELGAAVIAFQDSVDKLHDRIPQSRETP